MSKNRWRATSLVLFLAVVAAFPTGYFWELARPVLHKDIINKYAAFYKFDPLFVMALVKVESRFRKTARSSRGAIGLMQLMPETAKEMAQRTGMKISVEDVAHPEINIRLGIHYLSLLREEFHDDSVALLAAYNAGPSNVREWMKSGELTRDSIPFAETRRFVGNVNSTYRWLKGFQKIKNVLEGNIS